MEKPGHCNSRNNKIFKFKKSLKLQKNKRCSSAGTGVFITAAMNNQEKFKLFLKDIKVENKFFLILV